MEGPDSDVVQLLVDFNVAEARIEVRGYVHYKLTQWAHSWADWAECIP